MTRGVDGVFLVVGDEFSDDRALREEVSHLPIPAVMVDVPLRDSSATR